MHRSETIAHRADIFDQKGASRASTRARGRCEGHQSKPNSIFKPLGNPVKNERIVEMNMMKLSKVEKTCAQVVANVSSQHHDARPKGNGAESATDFSGTMRSKGGDLGKDDKADGVAQAERAQREQLAQQPHGLFGSDLPRCKCHGRRHDGFGMLRDSIFESEVRLQQVRTDCSGSVRGFDYGSTMIEALLPPRERYPAMMPSDLGLRAGSSLEVDAAAAQESLAASSQAPSRTASKRLQKLPPAPPSEPRPGLHGRPPLPPQSARPALPSFHHSEHSPEKRVGRQQPHRLQSLDEFIASAGPAIGVGGRSERSEGLKLREQINELLGLDKNVTLKLPPEEAGGRRGRLDIRRRIEKRMDEAWKYNQSRDFLKKWITAPKDTPGPIADIERILREEAAAAGGEAPEEGGGSRMAKLAAGERHLRDFPGLSDDRVGNDVERTNGVPGGNGEERDATGTAWASEPPEAIERRRKRERLDTDDAEAYAANFASVAKLRAALHAYQASRDEKRGGLEEVLHSMEVNRPNLIRRKLALGSTGASDPKASNATFRSEGEAGGDEHLQKQYGWYRELLCRVQDDKQNLPRVAHYIFDCIRQVLEYGEEFRREVFFAMLEKIQNFEFSRLIASLVVNMIRGIDGMSSQGLIGWFEQNRGEVPPAILELVERRPNPPPAPAVRPPSGLRVGRTLTFVTELP